MRKSCASTREIMDDGTRMFTHVRVRDAPVNTHTQLRTYIHFLFVQAKSCVGIEVVPRSYHTLHSHSLVLTSQSVSQLVSQLEYARPVRHLARDTHA